MAEVEKLPEGTEVVMVAVIEELSYHHEHQLINCPKFDDEYLTRKSLTDISGRFI